MRLPLTDATNPSSADLAAFMRMVDIFLERGFRYFDVAATYANGCCEQAVRSALTERYPREDYILADKLPTMLVERPERLRPIFDNQLRRCGVDYFDRYIIHCATAAYYAEAERLGSFAFAEEMKRAGLTRAIGFSYHDSPELLERILTEHPEVDFVQLQINYVDWMHTRIRARECYDTARRHGKPITVMSALKGGLLSSVPESAERIFRTLRPHDTPAIWALRYAASLEGTDYVLSGMSSVADMERNTAAMQFFEPFSESEYAAVYEAAEAVCDANPVQCTACGYCVPPCPAKIAIPDCLRLYNDYSRMYAASECLDGYADLTRRGGRASDCISCGRCERMCPQHLDIRRWIKRVADAFDGIRTTALA